MLLQTDPHCSEPNSKVLTSEENMFFPLLRLISAEALRGSSELKCRNSHENHSQIFK